MKRGSCPLTPSGGRRLFHGDGETHGSVSVTVPVSALQLYERSSVLTTFAEGLVQGPEPSLLHR